MNADLHHIRTHATLLAAQARLDAMAEPEPDEDWLTEEQAEESARGMLASTPNLVAGWLDADAAKHHAERVAEKVSAAMQAARAA